VFGGFGPAEMVLSIGHSQTLVRTVGFTWRKIVRWAGLARWPQPDHDGLGRFQGVVGRTVNRGQPGFSFSFIQTIPIDFQSPGFENSKHRLPGIPKFPHLAWLQLALNRTNFLFGPTSKSL
jgi:hypothetical protein